MRTFPVSTYSFFSVGRISRENSAQKGQRRSVHSTSTTGASTSPTARGSFSSRRSMRDLICASGSLAASALCVPEAPAAALSPAESLFTSCAMSTTTRKIAITASAM